MQELKACGCGGQMKCVDSRGTGQCTIRRRYKCLVCQRRKSTIEFEIEMRNGVNAGLSMKRVVVDPYLGVIRKAVAELNKMVDFKQPNGGSLDTTASDERNEA